MKNIFLVLAIALFLSGCVTNEQIRSINRSRLINLSPGISKPVALSIMGTETMHGELGLVINNPYRTEFYKAQGRNIEILYYYTEMKLGDNCITDDELTPLVFVDGKLDGWGWSYWQDMIKKYEIRIR